MCHYHAQAQARREAEEARKLEMTALDDRASIQLALVRVCHHLVEKSIDERTGRAIISALRQAQRNLGDQESLLCGRDLPSAEPGSPVKTVGISRGDPSGSPWDRSGSWRVSPLDIGIT